MSDDGLLTQEDIDAALGKVATSESTEAPGSSEADAAPDTASETGDGAPRPADIDAALNAASTSATESDANPSEAAGGSEATSAKDAIDAALAEAAAAQDVATDASQSAPPAPASVPSPPPRADVMGLPDFAADLASSAESAAAIDLLHDIDLKVKIELGRTTMHVADVLRLGTGSVVELDKLAGDPVDVYVNERLVARGEVLVLNDTFCVRVNDILAPPSRLVE